MNKEKLRGIFIEEAGEIIEKLDVEIIDLESRPNDKDLLNELFRGVHTLKGSANSFGFRRLGEFVHGFEDVLDYYRSSDDELAREHIDLFLDGVDVIKDVFNFEINEQEGLPDNYERCLNSFHNIMHPAEPVAPVAQPAPVASHNDLSAEFGTNQSAPSNENEGNPSDPSASALLGQLTEGENLYKISLNMDADLYLRGQDHSTFFRLLMPQGRMLQSDWDLSKVPELKGLDPQRSFIGEVNLYFASKESRDEIDDLFFYLEDYEYKIDTVDSPKNETPVTVPEAQAQEEKAVSQETSPAPAPSVSTTAKAKVVTPDKKQTSSSGPAEKQPVSGRRSFVKIDTAKLDELFDSVGELVIAQNFLSENKEINQTNDENIDKTIETLSKITRLIQSRVMSLRMVPIRDTFEKMKRVVRDASRKVNKEVELVIGGEETEIDKTMVDSLSDPLIHLVRNAIDHGLEATAEDRKAAGKDPIGKAFLRAYHKGGSIVIEIADDGRGINQEKVLQKAIANGLVQEGDELTEQQIFALIMQPGFSTADKISDISGRGVGLDVVRTSIENLRGKIEIESEPGKGSKFCIYLPLTLAIIDGMLVKSGEETFIIPTLSIIESFRPHKEIVHTAQGRGEFVNLREELLPIVRLNRVLELDDTSPHPWDCTLVCAENEKGRFAVLVDDLIGRQQVVIKSLGKTLTHLKEVSGGAVLGNGEIALILNVEGLY